MRLFQTFSNYSTARLFIVVVFFLLSSGLINAQSYTTVYTRSYNSSVCGAESFSFDFSSGLVTRTDKYYSTKKMYPSSREETYFDEKGYFVEKWGASAYLNAWGSLNGMDTYGLRLFFDKKGGNLLCIFEIQSKSGGIDYDGAKYYFTQLGYEAFCKR